MSATHEEQWRLLLAQFAFIADRGLNLQSYRALHNIYGVSRGDYARLTGIMARAGVITRAPRRRARWAPAWNRRKFQRAMKFDLIPLPYPKAGPPASFFRRSAGTHSTHAQA